MKFAHIFVLLAALTFLLQTPLMGSNPPSVDVLDGKPFIISPAHSLNLSEIGKRVKYPSKHLEKGTEEVITFFVKVSKDGEYLDHRLRKTSDPEMVKAVIKHLPNLKFKPAQLGESYVTQWVPITFRFQVIEK